MKQVTKQEMYDWLATQGMKPEDGVGCTICEPPQTHWRKEGELIAYAKWWDVSPLKDHTEAEFYIDA